LAGNLVICGDIAGLMIELIGRPRALTLIGSIIGIPADKLFIAGIVPGLQRQRRHC